MKSLIREKVFRKHYSKLLQSRKKKDARPSVNTVTSVTILTSSKVCTMEELKTSASYFSDLGIICHPYFLVYKSDDLDLLQDVIVIHAENCKYGVPNQDLLVKWLAKKSDLLIAFNPKKELLIKYLCAASNSKLKSSIKTEGIRYEDLDIDIWVDDHRSVNIPLNERCQLIYEMITSLGIRPPLIGD